MGSASDHLAVAKLASGGRGQSIRKRRWQTDQSVWRNIFMGRELANRWGMLDIGKMRSITQQ
jgi:simple sugar transport system ATP-binding protein